jgi:AcrR family transcriptional regulator
MQSFTLPENSGKRVQRLSGDTVSGSSARSNIASLEGRPKMRLSDTRVQQLIEAAMDEFLTRGFRRGAIENIARATGIGKATIYRHFGDKRGLFEAAVLAEIERLETSPFNFQSRAEPPKVVLCEFALRSLELFCRERSLTLHRMIIEAGHTFPVLARAVHDRLTEWSLVPLKAYLADMAAKDLLEIEDIDWTAHQLVNLATHGILFLMTPPPQDAETRRALAVEAVELFLGGGAAMRTALPAPNPA